MIFCRAFRHRFGGSQNSLVLAPLAGGRCPNKIEVEDRGFDGVKKPRGFEQMDGAGRRGIGAFPVGAGPRPAFAGRHQTQIGQTEIRHRPRAHANVHGELRAHQDDGRAAAAAWFGPICSGARHKRHISPIAIAPSGQARARQTGCAVHAHDGRQAFRTAKMNLRSSSALIIKMSCGAGPSGSAP